MKIFVGGDHQGAEVGKKIVEKLKEGGYQAEYTHLPNDPTDDYPDFAFDVCKHVLEDKDNIGVLICGNGIGISIAANKVKGIRCARVTTDEDVHHAKIHNGANVIAFGGQTLETALNWIHLFLETPAPNEARHLRRIEKIIKYEAGA